MLTYEQALRELKGGSIVRRIVWEPGKVLIQDERGITLHMPDGRMFLWHPWTGDLINHDYEVVERRLL